MSIASRSEVGCCLSCGRDTRGGDFCSHCRPRGAPSTMRGRKARPARAAELEDDYCEESDANSICPDGDQP